MHHHALPEPSGPHLGYRLEADGVVLVYATDHEPHARPHPDSPARPQEGHCRCTMRIGHIEFLSGADLIIHDAQYTAAEYAQKIGWGHSPVTYVVDVALAAWETAGPLPSRPGAAGCRTR